MTSKSFFCIDIVVDTNQFDSKISQIQSSNSVLPENKNRNNENPPQSLNNKNQATYFINQFKKKKN